MGRIFPWMSKHIMAKKHSIRQNIRLTSSRVRTQRNIEKIKKGNNHDKPNKNIHRLGIDLDCDPVGGIIDSEVTE
jgi:hypothetical protein